MCGGHSTSARTNYYKMRDLILSCKKFVNELNPKENQNIKEAQYSSKERHSRGANLGYISSAISKLENCIEILQDILEKLSKLKEK